jgi:hypothetical protein
VSWKPWRLPKRHSEPLLRAKRSRRGGLRQVDASVVPNGLSSSQESQLQPRSHVSGRV